MTTKLLIIGDSHTDALVQGCDSLGLPFYHVRSGGAAWFLGKYRFHRDKGLIAQPGPPRKQLRRVQEAMGYENIFDAGLPVLASFGFNLDRMTSMLDWHQHSIVAPDGSYERQRFAVSRQYGEDYIEAICGKNLRIIKQMARVAPVTMVLPPRAKDSHNWRQCADILMARMQDLGAAVFDPSAGLVAAGENRLDPKFLLEDGKHGGPDYGLHAMKALLASGQLPQVAAE